MNKYEPTETTKWKYEFNTPPKSITISEADESKETHADIEYTFSLDEDSARRLHEKFLRDQKQKKVLKGLNACNPSNFMDLEEINEQKMYEKANFNNLISKCGTPQKKWRNKR